MKRPKQLIAVVVAHVTQCSYCIKGHTKQAKQKGATNEEIMETIWVDFEMCAGAAHAHANLAIEEMDKSLYELLRCGLPKLTSVPTAWICSARMHGPPAKPSSVCRA